MITDAQKNAKPFAPDSTEGGEDLSRLLRTGQFIFREQWKLMLMGLGAGLALFMVIFLLTTPVYESKARFIFDQLPFLVLEQRQATDSISDQQMVQSLILSIPSKEMTTVVAERLGVPEENIVFNAIERSRSLANPTVANIEVSTARASRVGEITAESSDPHFAARVANAVAEEFSTINQIAGRLRKLDFELRLFRGKLERLTQEIVVVTSERIKFETQHGQLEEHLQRGNTLDNFPAFVEDNTLNNLKTQLVLVQGDYDAMAKVSVRGSRFEGKRAELEGMKQQVQNHAQQLANALQSSYLISKNREKDLITNISDYQKELAKIEDQRAVLIKSVGDMRLRRQLIKDDPTLAQDQTSVIVRLDQAQPNRRKKRPRFLLHVFLGGVFGSALGLGAALLRHHVDRRMRLPSQIEVITGTRCLAVLPEALVTPHSSNFWAHRANVSQGMIFLRNQILRHAMVGTGERIIALTGVGREAKTSKVVMELAVLLAKSEKRVLVVDINFDAPQQYKLLGIEPTRGLSEWYFGDEPLENFVLYSAVRQLALIHSGVKSDDLHDLMSRRPLGPELKRMEQYWDFIIIDSPSFLEQTHLLLAAPHGTQMIAVAKYASAELDDLIELQTRSKREDMIFDGVVLHDYPLERIKPSLAGDLGAHRYVLDYKPANTAVSKSS